jgi:hypothetical protein
VLKSTNDEITEARWSKLFELFPRKLSRSWIFFFCASTIPNIRVQQAHKNGRFAGECKQEIYTDILRHYSVCDSAAFLALS